MRKGSHQTPEAIEANRLKHLNKKDSQATKDKKSESHSGEKNAFYGKHHTEETLRLLRKPKSETAKKNMSKSKKGKLPANIEILKKSRIGLHNSESHNEKISGSLEGITRSEETKQLIAENRSGICCGIDNPAWNGGTSYLPYCYKFNERRKRAVRRFFGNVCLICKKRAEDNIANGRVFELSVHHIDHDKGQGCLGKPFNLVPLCLVDHNKEKTNQKEYREKINKILEEGFSAGTWSREQYEREVMYPE